MEPKRNLSGQPRYRFEHLSVEVASRPPNELCEWLTEVVDSVIQLCEAQLLTLTEVEAFQERAAAEARTLAAESPGHGAHHCLEVLQQSLQSLGMARELLAVHPCEKQPSDTLEDTLDEWLEWRRHLYDARCTCEKACQLWRKELRNGSISPDRQVQALVKESIQAIEKYAVLLRSTRLEDGLVQHEAVDKSALLHCQVLGYAGEAQMVSQFASLIVHDYRKWAAFLEALIRTKWLDSRSPRGFLSSVTSSIYRYPSGYYGY